MGRTKLHVGSLGPDVTENMLYHHFSRVGPVTTVKMEQDVSKRKYAYVYFTEQTDAERALQTLDNTNFKGRRLRINWAESDTVQRRFENANIYVKNLPDSVSDMEMRDLFSRFGNIICWKVATDDCKRSKGFGSVQFQTEEAAESAIQYLNGKMLYGKQLYVGKHKSQEDRTKEKEESFTNVFVKNFGDELDDEGLEDIFKEYGKITSCKVMTDDDGNSKGFGFVNFSTSEDAKMAVDELHEAELVASDGSTKTLYVQRFQTKAERESLKQKTLKCDTESGNLYIKNLHDSVSDAGLRKMFEEFGKIISAKVMMDDNGNSRCFGFVCLSSLDEADEARKAMHGTKIGSKTLYVDFAQAKEEREAQLRAKFAQSSSSRRPTVIKSKPDDRRRAQSTPRFTSGLCRPNMAENHGFMGQRPLIPYNHQHFKDYNAYVGAPLLKPGGYQPVITDKTKHASKFQKQGSSAGGSRKGSSQKKKIPVESSCPPVQVRKPAK